MFLFKVIEVCNQSKWRRKYQKDDLTNFLKCYLWCKCRQLPGYSYSWFFISCWGDSFGGKKTSHHKSLFGYLRTINNNQYVINTKTDKLIITVTNYHRINYQNRSKLDLFSSSSILISGFKPKSILICLIFSVSCVDDKSISLTLSIVTKILSWG